MLRSKSRAGLGFGGGGGKGPSNDKNKENPDCDDDGLAEKENVIESVPLTPSRSMRHKLKQSFTNFTSRLGPKEGKSTFYKSSPSIIPNPTDIESGTTTATAAAAVPLPESPCSETTPLPEKPTSSTKSPGKGRKYLSFSLGQEGKFKMDSKTAALLLATANPETSHPAKEDTQKAGDAGVKDKGKGKASEYNDSEDKSLASMKEDIIGQAITAPYSVSSLEHQHQAIDITLLPPPAVSSKEKQSTILSSNEKSTEKAKAKGKKAVARTNTTTTTRTSKATGINRPPTPIPSPLSPPFPAIEAPEQPQGSGLTIQINQLLERLDAGETIDYKLKNPEGYVDDDPDCIDFFDDPECWELLGITAPLSPPPGSRHAKSAAARNMKR